MAEMRQLNLAQLKQLIEGKDEDLANNYISRNVAVARNVRLNLIKEQIVGQPTLMPEMRILIIKNGWAAPVINMVEAIGNRIPQAFDGHLRHFQLHLQPSEQEYLDQLHLMLYRHLRQPDGSSQVTLHLLSAFLWYVDHLWSRHEQTYRESQTREQRLFSDFIQLVSEFAPMHHTIDFYASRLCLTPRYMSTIIRQVSGKSAKQWIDDALVARIKIELKHTDKPVARICDDMNFPNPSFLTKFFKRMTGQTPSQYR